MADQRIPWPPIDGEITEAVLRQLNTSISIYDRGTLFRQFEERFARLHACRYALLTSSGTAALHSAYFGLGLGPGDEVLCPAYTFFATATPLFQLGALPVLVDATPEGILDLDEARRMVTSRTKALVITHMWGFPAPTVLYRRFCDEHGLTLVEDCSHAHGAAFDGTPVGALADAATWSLQAGKLVAAGEGGILCTNDQNVYVRATLLGHFNKRAMAEVPTTHPLHRYAETGLGLKYRAHPLGIAMASVYLDRLQGWLDAKQVNAERITEIVRASSVLEPMWPPSRRTRRSYYAYPMLVMSRDATDVAAVRQQLVAGMHEFGFSDVDIPGSTRSLGTFPLFQEQQSPVTTYQKKSVRRPLLVADYLSNALVKIPVPVDYGARTEEYFDAFGRCLASVEKSIPLNDTTVATGIARPIQRMALDAAAQVAQHDAVEQLVVGALVWRLRGNQPQVLLARRRPDDFLGGYEELVGGGVEPTESLLDALHREVLEETGADPAIVEGVIGTFDYVNEWGRRARQVNFGVRLAGEPCVVAGGEHTSIRWITATDLETANCTPEVKHVLRRWFTLWSAGIGG